jgi:3-oxoacyl-(acyl-carrier-protein) synthase
MTEQDLSPVKRALLEIRDLRARLAAAEAAAEGLGGPVAIIGMGLRMPGGAVDAASLADLLWSGTDTVGPIPSARWPAAELYDADPDAPGRMITRHGAFLDGIDLFDAELFGISPREAASMDPQQRIMLEVAWHALEDAGLSPLRPGCTRCGVYLGVSNSDYGRALLARPELIDAYAASGSAFSVLAGRISYALGLQGPSMAIDTACSSSLVALHLACQALRGRECDMALAGGINLILSPELNIGFTKARMMAPDGRCKSFDAAADGYVRGEGAGILVLRRLADAQAAGDRILAVIHGSAVNQDGSSQGLTAPNGPAQEAVIRAALAQGGIDASEVSFVEAHGTGTPLGDPIELGALAAVFAPGRDRRDALLVGSVKTNLGHLEAAAGIAGVIKMVLSLQAGALPPNLHYRTGNPRIDWDALPISVPTECIPWRPASGRRVAGVSSFGFSGTNAHVVLGEAPAGPPRASAAPAGLLLPLSARDPAMLRELAGRYAAVLESHPAAGDLCLTAGCGRAHHAHRLAVIGDTASDLRDGLAAFLACQAHPAVAVGEAGFSPGDVLPASGADAAWPLHRLQRAYVAGADIDWDGVFAGRGYRRAAAPLSPLRRSRHWIDPAPDSPGPQLWEVAAQALDRRAGFAPIDVNIAAYAQIWPALERLTAGHALSILRQGAAFADPSDIVTVDAAMQACGILAGHRRLIRRWLERLSEHGVLLRAGQGYRAPAPLPDPDLPALWQAAETKLAGDPPLLAYLRHCGALLGDVLRGRVSPLETLFPGGSFELADGLYRHSAMMRYVHGLAAEAIGAAAASARSAGRGLRIMEVGGGSGATTACLLPLLDGAASYVFTDVSDLFLTRAQALFAAAGMVSARRFDMDRDPAEQDFAAAAFDLILATNAVHASIDLPRALGRLRGLLRPGGALLLIESTLDLAWFDMSTGLIEGWQHFADAARGDQPLLSAPQWRQVLAEAGFQSPQTWPQDGSPAEWLGQHVILAFVPGMWAAQAASDVAPAPAQVAAPPPDAATLPRARIEAALPDERRDLLRAYVRGCVMRVLRRRADDPPGLRDRLMDLGIDSLMAIQLRAELAAGLDLPDALPATLVFDHPTIAALADLLDRTIGRPGAAPRVTGPVAGGLAESRDILDLGAIAALSDEQIEALVLQQEGPA